MKRLNEMKKITAIMTVCTAAMLMTACGGKGTDSTVTSRTVEESKQSESTKEITPSVEQLKEASVEVTMDALLNHAETPAEDFQYEIYDEHAWINGYTGTDPIVVIPNTIEGYPVTEVSNLKESGIQAIKFSDSVETIRENCFLTGGALEEETMEKLKIVVMGENVKLIGENAFLGCGNLDTIVLNDSLEEIETAAFRQTAIKEIRIPESVIMIADPPFSMDATQTVYVKSGSYAETWCEEHKENFSDFTYVVE